MAFATLQYNGEKRIAVRHDDDWVILPASMGDMVALIEGGKDALARARRYAASPDAPRVAVGEARLLAPIQRFSRDVLCTGWNYWDHFEEGKGKREGQDVPAPTAPTFFTKGPDTVIGPVDDIAYDASLSAKWDYEAEMVVIIGKTGRSIPVEDAMAYVWGYCLANDISQRDLQRRHGGQWLKGKSIDATMPLGPWIVPADEVDPANVQLECVVNGTVLQSASTRLMAFSIPELIAELSFGMTLRAGDVLLTGTPSGIGNAREPQVFLHEGDEVIVRGSGLGELRNRMTSVDLHGKSGIRIGV
ncbi:fumarylacetoacetate hydrolase family protein [Pandoraea sputorum]|uniref:Ureidoglycolate lyase n=1 Tax=Pandoraea sputorum TaxID=93222 RepID=A0A239SDI5_9BURK|nr:fumarylacetoacetate hydrolase family protein [Pandoraea sputorum]AJC16543.1 5-carboxymethyl-2-hydroxymuconate isomerase [Pandoraea sputorum]SNU83496.1 Ureidoglycolate lyase [Pandoraea sputorum]VVD97936.1 5-carboxymethyl-2-hydroxymuconate isomerase [Pandoraea sputorum]